MNANIEKRIVEMRFENEQFEKAAGQTLTTLGKLDNILDVLGEAGANQLTRTLETIQYRFSSFGIAAASVIENITGKVVGLTASLLRAIPEKIISGGINRAFNLEDAEFRLKGLGVAWAQIEDDMDYAVKDTAYGLDEAAQAASILAAANINWKNDVEGASDMAHALRAISGVAAMTGSSYSDIASVLTDVAAAGRVTGDVITRLAYRGMNVTAVLAKSMGKSQQEVQKMIEDGTLTVQQFYLEMDKAFGEHATKANETYSGSLMNIGAALSRIGADYIQPLHKALIPINNALRLMFNRMREVTKPFAEGVFTSYLTRFKDKILPIIENIKFDGLKIFFGFATRVMSLIDKALDKIIALGKVIKNFFHYRHEMEETLENGEKQFWIDTKAYDRWLKLQKILYMFSRAAQMARDTLRLFGTTINRITGGALTKLIDLLLTGGAKLADLFSNNEANIWRKITSFMEKLETFGMSLKNIFGSSLRIVWTVLTNIFNALRNVGVFDTLGRILSWIGDKIVYASQKLEGFLKRLEESVKSGTALDTLRVIFGGIGDAIGTAFKTLKEFGRYLFGLEEGETLFDKLGPVVDGINKIIAPVFETLGKALEGFFSGEDNALQAAVKLFAALWGFRKIQKIFWGFQRGKRGASFLSRIFGKDGIIKEFEEWVKILDPKHWAMRIETLLDRTAQALRSFSNNLDADSLLKIGGGILMLAFALSILSAVASDEAAVTRGMTALTGIMLILVGALYLMKRITTGSLFKDIAMSWEGLFNIFKNGLGRLLNILTLKEAAKSLLYFAAAVLILVVAVGALAFMFTKLDPKDVWQAVGAVGALAGVLILMILAMSVAFKIAKGLNAFDIAAMGGALVAIAFGILLLAGAVALFANIASKEGGERALWMGVGAIAALAVILGVLTAVMSRFIANPAVLAAGKAMKSIAWALLITAAGMWVLGEALKKFEGIQWQTILAGLGSMMSVVIILSLLSKYTKNTGGLMKAGGAILLVAIAMGILVMAFKAFDSMVKDDATSYIMFIGLLGAMCVALLALSYISDKLSAASTALIKLSGAMLIAAIAIGALGLALLLYENQSPDTIMNMAITLVAIAGAFVLINKVLKPKDIALAAASLILVAVSLIGIGFAMQLFEGINLEDVVSMFFTLLAISAVAGLLGAIGGQVLLGAVALAAIGLAMLVAAPGLKAIGNALPFLADGLRAFEGIGLQEIGAALGGTIVAALLGLLALPVLSFGTAGVMVLTALGTALPVLADGIAAFGKVSGWDIVKTLGGVATGIGSILAIKLAKNGVNDFYTVAVGLDMIAEAVLKIPEDIGRILKDFAKGIETGVPEINNALNSLIKVMVDSFNSDVMRRNWITIGRNIVVGIANGINQNGYIAQNALTRLANSLQRTFTVHLAIRSPSRVFESLAVYIPLGIARGIQNGEGAVTNAMINTMSGALGYLEGIGDSSTGLSPKITPVMDLSRMRTEYGQADQLFRNSAISSFGGLNGINVNGDSINYNMKNRDVVDAVLQMSDKIARLGSEIENLKLVMDTGLVVGALAPQMNSQLGVMAVREGRQ